MKESLLVLLFTGLRFFLVISLNNSILYEQHIHNDILEKQTDSALSEQ